MKDDLNLNNLNKVTYFAETDGRRKISFGIKTDDRSKHVYVIGKTGMGKSTLLENMAIQDIQNGNGMAFVDPHGKTAETLLDYVPKERLDDIVYFAPFDMEHPMSFNIMEDVGYDKRHLVASGLMSAFKKIWVDMWSARMEYILSNVIMALLEYPDSTLLGVNRMLTDNVYRKKIVTYITDPSVKSFWVDEFAKYTDKYTQEATPAIQNKVGQFTANPLIRNIIGQPKSSFDLRKLMDEKKILIINLSKGLIGEGNANLLGSMLITKLYLSAMSRADKQEHEIRQLPNFYLYVDEFQSFANESFADILSEARKYKLNLTIAHQYIEQVPEEVRSAVFGNVGTMIVFRVGAYDAEVLEKEFAPKFYIDDLVSLGFAQIYLKLMINGVSSHPFSATTLPPILPPKESIKSLVIERSRKLYTKPRDDVQKAIDGWYGQEVNLDKKQTEKTTVSQNIPSVSVYKNTSTPPTSTISRLSQKSSSITIPVRSFQKSTTTTPVRSSQKSSSITIPVRSSQKSSSITIPVRSSQKSTTTTPKNSLLIPVPVPAPPVYKKISPITPKIPLIPPIPSFRSSGNTINSSTVNLNKTFKHYTLPRYTPIKINEIDNKIISQQISPLSQPIQQQKTKKTTQTETKKKLFNKPLIIKKDIQTSKKFSRPYISQQRAKQQKTQTFTPTRKTTVLSAEKQIPKSISLDVLKQETKKMEKFANLKNLQTLKDTLHAVMEKEKFQDKTQTITNIKAEEKKIEKSQKPQEIPKDILEAMLKVKDE